MNVKSGDLAVIKWAVNAYQDWIGRIVEIGEFSNQSTKSYWYVIFQGEKPKSCRALRQLVRDQDLIRISGDPSMLTEETRDALPVIHN